MVGIMFAGAVWGVLGVHITAKYRHEIVPQWWDGPEEYLLMLSAFVFSQIIMLLLDFVDFVGLTYSDAAMATALVIIVYDLSPAIVKQYSRATAVGAAAGTAAVSVPRIKSRRRA